PYPPPGGFSPRQCWVESEKGRLAALEPQSLSGRDCITKCNSPPAMISSCRMKVRVNGLLLRRTEPTKPFASLRLSTVMLNCLPLGRCSTAWLTNGRPMTYSPEPGVTG